MASCHRLNFSLRFANEARIFVSHQWTKCSNRVLKSLSTGAIGTLTIYCFHEFDFLHGKQLETSRCRCKCACECQLLPTTSCCRRTLHRETKKVTQCAYEKHAFIKGPLRNVIISPQVLYELATSIVVRSHDQATSSTRTIFNSLSLSNAKLFWNERIQWLINSFYMHTDNIFQNHRLNATEKSSEESEKDTQETEAGDVFFMRKERFLSFASVLYDGEVYMTPQDFLQSVTQEGARARKYRIAVDDAIVKRWLKQTPVRCSGDARLFRSLNEQGLISYVEYLFLLCILTEAKSGFEIAFNMFDIDGNQRVDVDEFKVLTMLFSETKRPKPTSVKDQLSLSDVKPVNSIPTTREEIKVLKESERVKRVPVTTLLVHLFGDKGKSVLKYEDFAKFTQNLQEEVLDMEFQQYAKGQKTISEEDFARVLLRYTNLSDASIDEYLMRVTDRIVEAKGIDFDDFKKFFLFLNHMDDFTLMMRLYNLTDQPISKEEFRRAVSICGGVDMSAFVVDAVYTIFDVDGDGHLSTEEFVSIMKSRLKRGLKSHLVKEEHGWPKLKKCIRHEMRVKRGGM
ncbi:calcium uptake protein 3, mitochondrial-like [Watersipora subatra]|uniref:calcium uptake protein 3, mitochondrial-like n=1 Tax=Watersipora subatra TaxID=2589382 RepID=UPI00355BA7D9